MTSGRPLTRIIRHPISSPVVPYGCQVKALHKIKLNLTFNFSPKHFCPILFNLALFPSGFLLGRSFCSVPLCQPVEAPAKIKSRFCDRGAIYDANQVEWRENPGKFQPDFRHFGRTSSRFCTETSFSYSCVKSPKSALLARFRWPLIFQVSNTYVSSSARMNS